MQQPFGDEEFNFSLFLVLCNRLVTCCVAVAMLLVSHTAPAIATGQAGRRRRLCVGRQSCGQGSRHKRIQGSSSKGVPLARGGSRGCLVHVEDVGSLDCPRWTGNAISEKEASTIYVLLRVPGWLILNPQGAHQL